MPVEREPCVGELASDAIRPELGRDLRTDLLTRVELHRQVELGDLDRHGAPSARLATAWLEARAEWGPGVHEDGFGLLPSDEVDSPAGFAAWIARLADASDQVNPVAAGQVRCTYRWIVEGKRVLGGIALRHTGNDDVQWAGHIGYGIRPSARRRGLATWALGRILDQARVLGMDRVLIVCEADNVASAKTTERLGGLLEDVRDTEDGAARRYWIELSGPST